MDAPESTPAFPDPIPGIIPFGSICTFAGASGVGKTAFYAGWIRAWQAGEDICGHATNCPVKIGVLVGDRSWKSHRQWLDAAGVSDSVVHYSLRDVDFPWQDLRLGPRVALLFNKVLDAMNLPPGSLLIIDPMALWLPGRTNDYKDVAIGLGVLDQLVRPRGITILGIFHQSKQVADKSQQYSRPQDKILGSAATIGFSDTAMYLLGPEDMGEQFYGFGWIPHNAKSETFNFVRDLWGLFVPYVPSENVESLEAIHAIIPPEGCTTQEILTDAAPLARATIFNCLKRLIRDGRVVQVRRGVYRRATTA